MKEPPRGQYEKDDVLGEVFEDENPAPISMEAAFARLKKIATIRTSIAAFCALGFALFSQPGLESLYLDDTFAKQTLLQRGLILALPGIAALPILPFIGSYFDRTYRKNPPKALALVGLLIIPSGLLLPLQFTTHSEILFVLYKAPQAVFTACVFAMVSPVLQGVCPYRLRGMGAAMGTMYIFFIGGFLGNLVAGFLVDADRRARHRDLHGDPDRDRRRPLVDERRALHPQRSLARGGGAAGGTGRASQAHGAG